MSLRIGIDIGSTTVKVVVLDEDNKLLFRSYERHYSKARERACETLHPIEDKLRGKDVKLVITGSAGLGVAKAAGIAFVQEVYATAAAGNTYIPGTAAVIELGHKVMWFTAPFYATFVCIEIFSGAVRGTGDSLQPMLLTCSGVCVLRVLWVLLVLPHFRVLETVLVSYPISWTVTSLLYIIYYARGNWLRRGIARAGLSSEDAALSSKS